mgnify:CR=1 FL=1
MKTRNIVTGALLSALSLMISLVFGQSLSVFIPPFSATLASHVPTMIAFTVSPGAAVMVGLVSAFGFLIAKGPVVAARALVHAVFGFVGACSYRKDGSLLKALAITAPIHALGEALAVIPFGFDLRTAFLIVGVGTIIHHGIDAAITLAVVKSLSKSRNFLEAKRI